MNVGKLKNLFGAARKTSPETRSKLWQEIQTLKNQFERILPWEKIYAIDKDEVTLSAMKERLEQIKEELLHIDPEHLRQWQAKATEVKEMIHTIQNATRLLNDLRKQINEKQAEYEKGNS